MDFIKERDEIATELFKDDCLDFMRGMESDSVDLIITSPPYNIGKMHSNTTRYGTYAGNDMKESDYQTWQIDVLNECYRILKPEGSMFYNHKVRIKQGKAIHPLEWVLDSKFTLKQEITWDQAKSANTDKIRFFPFSERIYWLTKTPKTKLFNVNKLSDVWRVVPTGKRKDMKHIAVMPEQIVQNILDSVEGQIVFDPFLGSGTTGVVAVKNNRDFIGVELDKDYLDIATERIQKAKGKLLAV